MPYLRWCVQELHNAPASSTHNILLKCPCGFRVLVLDSKQMVAGRNELVGWHAGVVVKDRLGLGRGCLADPTDAPSNAPTNAPPETPTRITRLKVEPSDPDATALVAGLSANITGRWDSRSCPHCGLICILNTLCIIRDKN